MTENKKLIVKDFTRELSVWQQEIEVEANHYFVPKFLGAKCSVFFFSHVQGINTAFRLSQEREELPLFYIKKTKQKNFGFKLFKLSKPKVDYLKKEAKKLSLRNNDLDLNKLFIFRNLLIDLWPAYLFGYNISRYQEKEIFKPKNKIEEDNLIWAKKLHLYCEGIYDVVETAIGQGLKPLFKKNNLKIELWRQLKTVDLIRAIGFDMLNEKILPNIIIDEIGIHAIELDNYLKANDFIIERNKKIKNNVLKGTVACGGKFLGKVRLISKNDLNSFTKFVSGEILVSLTTSPSYLPLIKRSGAILTEFGGLSSHAAIAAREFNIPCLVGISGLTKLLKTGDKIEVDAVKGTIKRFV